MIRNALMPLFGFDAFKKKINLYGLVRFHIILNILSYFKPIRMRLTWFLSQYTFVYILSTYKLLLQQVPTDGRHSVQGCTKSAARAFPCPITRTYDIFTPTKIYLPVGKYKYSVFVHSV